tara:strand:+ start:31117 stop:31452 length:336 start_codon:yes stop_codon:yes gene_type:complete
MKYHNRKFKTITSSENSEVSSKMIFTYKQNNSVITCSYKDTSIVKGHLIGLVDEHGIIHISYHQVNNKNKIMTGTCISTPEILENGKIRLHEKWQWTSGDFSEGTSIIEEI